MSTNTLTLTLSVSDWNTIRTALICHSCDVRTGVTFQNPEWADETLTVHKTLKGLLETV